MFFRAIYLNKTTVLVGQMDQFQEHQHTYYGNRWGRNVGDWGNMMSVDAETRPSTFNITGTENNPPRYGTETRSKNISIKIWQRIA